ncbi:MAG: peptidoglycan DD-metalloendopeptidase family protein, partial [Geminicoccaceae bacterium]
MREAVGNAMGRSRVLVSVTLFAFGAGFWAGVLSNQTVSRTELGSPGAVRTAELTPGAFLGVERLRAHPARAEAPTHAERAVPQAVEPAAASAEPATAPPSTPPTPAMAAPEAPAGDMPVVARPVDGLSSDAELGQEARLAKAALPRNPWSVEQVTVRRGDTLIDILSRAGVDPGEAHAAVTSLRALYDPRRLRAGQDLVITASGNQQPKEAGPRRLLALALDLDFDHTLRVTRGTDGSYATAKLERPQQRQTVLRSGTIHDSLYLAAERAALPQDLIAELIKLFSWDVDFQRDIRPGDSFETVYEEISLQNSLDDARSGDLLYARLTLDGRDLEGYRFALPDGTVEFYDRTGKSLRKFLLRTPVDGARISSRFGMRRHPILGYTRMHQGVDFAVPTGTPIYAAGNGRITKAGRNGGYGNYIRIRHNGEYSTAYGHMSRLAKGMAPGRRVVQGQVIGYVGSTGQATGPHLHYEVLKDGTQINPLKIKQFALGQLSGKDLERFKLEMARIDRLRDDLADGTQVA